MEKRIFKRYNKLTEAWDITAMDNLEVGDIITIDDIGPDIKYEVKAKSALVKQENGTMGKAITVDQVI